MNAHRSIFLVASLSLAACTGSPTLNSPHGVTAATGQLTVHIVEASGGA